MSNLIDEYRSRLRQAMAQIQRMEGEMEALEQERSEPIAIVGMACRFPGGSSSPEAFLRYLCEGGDAVTEVPPERWPLRPSEEEAPELRGARWGAFLRDVDLFDASFFGISPREAVRMDPQQRLLLEVGWEAFERAGLPIDVLAGTKTGVFVGISGNDFLALAAQEDVEAFEIYDAIGTGHCFSAGRISYLFGLQGPAVAVDTACSSSLVALHLACQALRVRECDAALVAGVNLMFSPATTNALAKSRALSPDGRARTFDGQANGFVRGEGCGAIVVKRLSDAQRDGDTIHAVVLGSAINQDGRSAGFTAPNMRAQEAVLEAALERAGVSPQDIGFVETHGTGTSLGDPIEAEALREKLGVRREDGTSCVLGALKTNVGHLEAAAGIASIIKCALVLEGEVIPKNNHFQALNPRISLEGTPLVVPRQNRPWKRGEKPRRAGVSSFGMSGTNAHVVLEEAPAEERAEAKPAEVHLLPISAKTPEALVALARAFHDHLAAGEGASLSDVVYTASARRMHHAHRLAVVGRTDRELAAALAAHADGDVVPGVVHAEALLHATPKVVFVFSGQGSQWVGMGRELFEQESTFRDALAACDAKLAPYAGFSVVEELLVPEERSRLGETMVAQPALFAFEVALAETLKSWGIQPDLVVGHSVGEIAAAHVAGILDLDQAARLVALRGRIMQKATGHGKMVSISLTEAEAERALAGLEASVGIAAVNDEGQVVLSGDVGTLDRLVERLSAQGVQCRPLRVDYAFHSPQMEPLRREFVESLGSIEPGRGSIPMISTVTGAQIAGESLHVAYWGDNIRKPVRFADAISHVLQRGHLTFVEIGPHAVLSQNIEQILLARGAAGRVVPTCRRNKGDRTQMLLALSNLYVHGHTPDFRRLYPGGGRVVPLPTYPWQRKRFWPETRSAAGSAARMPLTGHPLLGSAMSVAGVGAVYESVVDTKAQPYLDDHRVFEDVVVPGAALVETALSAGALYTGTRWALAQLTIQAPLRIPAGGARRLQVVVAGSSEETLEVALYSRSTDDGRRDAWTLHAKGQLRPATALTASRVDLDAIRSRCGTEVAASEVYGRVAAIGIQLGPAFQGMSRIWKGRGEALAKVALPDAAGDATGYGIHPALLDAVLQTVSVAVDTPLDHAYVPFEFGDVTLLKAPAGGGWAHGRIVSEAPDGETITIKVTLSDDRGDVVLEVANLRFKRARFDAIRGSASASLKPLYRVAWQARAFSGEAQPPAGQWLVVSDGTSFASAIVDRIHAFGARALAMTVDELVDRYDDYVRVGGAPRGVLCVLDSATAGDDAAATASAAEQAAVFALRATQAIVKRGATTRLWFVTRGAQAVESGEGVSPAGATWWGFGRTVLAEHPELGLSLVDVGTREEGALDALWQELCHPDDEEHQIAWRDGKRLAARLVKAEAGRAAARGPITKQSTVLVTGGLGVLGLAVAQWLWDEHRVGHLLLVGRNAPTGECTAQLARLRDAGARVTVAHADVSRPEDVAAVVASVPEEFPLRGVIHAAGILDDGLLMDMDERRIAAVFAPKVRGAWNLHLATRGLPLDFFVLYSSASCVLGSAGQCNYTAANAYLDALAQARRASGLPALSLGWGPWGEGGMAAALSDAHRARFARMGVQILDPAQALAALGQALTLPDAGLVVASLDPQSLERANEGRLPPLWTGLMAPKPTRLRAAPKGIWGERLATLDPAALSKEVDLALRADIVKVLSLSSPDEVPEDRPLQEIGLDSLVAVELRNAIVARIGKPLPATLLFDYPSLRALRKHLLERVLSFEETKAAAPVAPVVRAAADDGVAVIGVGCRFPGGIRDLDSFWRVLEQGVDAIQEVPPDRWDIDAHYDPDPDAPGKMYTRWGGFVDQIDRFEANFFGISPREARSIDPQQRLLLETTWEALEHAGIPAEQLQGSNTGVYVGITGSDYQSLAMADPERIDAYSVLGTQHSTTVGRLSYWLGLQGPNVSIDTACSSALVAVHLACQAIRFGECSMAIAGGVNVVLQPELTVFFSRLKAMSPTGRCHTFSADADGYVRSDGCGVLLLKRLSDAQRDGDPILAVVRGTAINQDGRSQGLTAPNGPAQEAVIRAALREAHARPLDVDYVEAHGTGTPLGDPIEVQALGAAYGAGRTEANPLIIGSGKTNIGHSEGAAGAAGLMKAILSVRKGAIPGILHFTAPNPRISWSELPVKVAAEMMPWPSQGKPRMAGVNAFAVSGTNAHVIVEEPPRSGAAPAVEGASAYLLPLSAKSPEALSAAARTYAEWLLGTNDLSIHDVAYTASVRRTHHEYRLAAVGATREELSAQLSAFVRGESPSGRTQSQGRPKVVFVFSGQGSQWAAMGQKLQEEEPVFRDKLHEIDRLLRAHVRFSLLEELAAPEERSRLGETEIVQPALFALEVALAELLKSWGVVPDAVIGHSVGEVAAAHVSGALSLAEAVRLVALRGRIMQKATGHGKMAWVSLPPVEAAKALEGREAEVAIAAVNDPTSVVLSGETAALEQMLAKLSEQGVATKQLRVNYAFHSPQMESLSRELSEMLGRVETQKGATPMYSTVTGGRVQGTALDAGYWQRNVRGTVDLVGAVSSAYGDEHRLFVEVGPHPVLLSNLQQWIESSRAQASVMSTLRRQGEERRAMLEALGRLYVAGVKVDFKYLHRGGGRVVSLPAYPWQRERFWLDAPMKKTHAIRGDGARPLLGAGFVPATTPELHVWEQWLGVEAFPYLQDHRVQGEVVFPGAGYVEMALSAAAELYGEGAAWLDEMSFDQMLALPEGTERLVQVSVREESSGRATVTIASRSDGSKEWLRHATGVLRVSAKPAAVPDFESPAALEGRCPEVLEGAAHYRDMEARGLSYGKSFQGVEGLRIGEGEVVARVRLPEALRAGARGYQVHPALLDACFQAAGHALQSAIGKGTFVPVKVTSVAVHARPEGEVLVHARVAKDGATGEPVVSIVICDEAGRVLVEIGELWVRRLAEAAQDPFADCVFQVPWRPKELASGTEAPTGTWLVFMDGRGTGMAVAERLRARGHTCVEAVAGAGYSRRGEWQYQVNPADPEQWSRLLGEALGKNPCRGVIHCAALDGARWSETTEATLAADVRAGTSSVLWLAQALLRHGWRDVPRLYVLTRAAQAAGSGTGPLSVAQSTLWGLGRVVAMEHPELGCVRIDLPPEVRPDEPERVVEEVLWGGEEDHVALRPEGRYVARLARGGFTEGAGTVERQEPAEGRPYRLEITEPGVLERLCLRRMERRPPGPGEVEIEVEAAGLNFLDVLLALGVLPDDVAGSSKRGPRLGGECAGRIVALGEGVQDLTIGQEVIALATSAMSTHVTASRLLVAPKPAGFSWEAAAALPIVSLTAYYSLAHVARLRKGERVLIHAGAGGVGMAAIQWARHVGAEIFATAGSPQKHALLTSLGVHHVMDSRSTSFVNDVERITKGEGVDVVLNSLSGELLEASFGLLRDHGRFVEIGKRDYYDNRRLGLRPFLKNLSFSLVDLRGMTLNRPELVAELLHELGPLFASGVLRPIPHRAFPVTKAAEAFAWMAQGKHTGKLVISMRDPDAKVIVSGTQGSAGLRADATYLITGGLGGLGASLARWMVEQGARHVALMGRSVPKDAAMDAIRRMEAAGAEVRVLRGDVSRRADLDAALAEIQRTMPPLRGVVHAAAVLDDRTIPEMTEEQFWKPLGPKVFGAWNLHEATRGVPLDFFVMYSSAAGLLGSPGQANYAAANTFLDALCQARAAEGLPGMSIQWGAFSEVGLAAAAAVRGNRAASRGNESFKPDEGNELFGRLLEHPRPEVGLLRFDPRQWVEFYPQTVGAPFFSELSREQAPSAGGTKASDDFRAVLQRAASLERMGLVETHLLEQVGRVLRLEPGRIDKQAPFVSLGMDSLMSLELRNRLEASTGLKLSAALLFTHATPTALAAYLLERLLPQQATNAPAEPASTAQVEEDAWDAGLAGGEAGSEKDESTLVEQLEAFEEYLG
ncbi:type I polyketide synthase [Polyangium sp. 15x6]|uniref:type I polyketide synthase n=1 Tax=Polyangium sp. 15x6 TaxID=3042687 RepID=UPI00249A8C8A|nr:type I polyketide synthase [Polyangium sp. 15x6]MDI3284904.1 SDR family NAD(P)-dependent oxidoreductase [Polyangium sp. 15x6]